MKVSHNWLKEYIGDSIPSAEKIEELLTFHSFEIEGLEKVGEDSVIDIDILPNRSSDCLCHRGIAREIATLTNTPLTHDPLTELPDMPASDVISVDIEDPKACPRFTAALITNIEVKPSPQWLVERLDALGQRSINNIVDATNYVMYALGQPLHAYDADLFPQVDGSWQFGVRYAKEGEVVSLIAEGGKDEDRDVVCTGTEVLIVDKSSDTPIGLAGVKGGKFAGVHEGTTSIIVEAAHFDPNITRKTARRLGIVIDASKRFENECSRELPLYAQSQVMKLIADIAGGVHEGVIDVYLEKYQPTTVEVDPKRVNALLGVELPLDEMISVLNRAGCDTAVENETIKATGPFERTDLLIEEDFIEEIGRIHGYHHVQSVVPDTVPLAEVNQQHYYSELIREVLLNQGFDEVITSSFRKKDQIRLKNALASDKEYLRSCLLKNISEVLDRNAGFTDLLGTQITRVFEIGTVFTKTDQGIQEHTSLCLGVRIKPSGYTGKEDKMLDTVMSELETALNATIDRDTQKGVTEINLSQLIEVLPVTNEYQEGEKSVDVQYQPFSLYPSMSRDIAMWTTEGTTPQQVQEVLNGATGELRVRTTFVDEFTKDGKTSLAFRLVFQAPDRTLTDEEVGVIMEKVNDAVAEQKWEVR